MAKASEEEIYRTGEIIGPGTYKSVKSGKIVHKEKVGPIPPSGDEIEYTKLSDDPHFQLSEEEIQERQKGETSHEAPATRHAKTGEIVAPGTWRCQSCGYEITFKEEGHLPPCPRDTGTNFEHV
jgi:rubrerythrin